MDLQAEKMKVERLDNEDLIPEDVHGNHIEIVKEQILDLNDKFDFLISLMIKNQKLDVKTSEQLDDADFTLQDQVDSSLNRGSIVGLQSDEILTAVKAFQKKAKKVTGEDRKQLRKAEPKRPLIERVRDAIQLQEELENKKNQ